MTWWYWVIYDDNPKVSLEEKIAVAAIKFRRKFKVYPKICLVLPSAIAGLRKVGLIEVRPKLNALQNHLWLGVLNDPRPRI